MPQEHATPILATAVRAALWDDGATTNGPTAVANGPTKSADQPLKKRKVDEPNGGTAAANGGARELASARHQPLLVKVLAKELGVAEGDILDFELQLVDAQPATVRGLATTPTATASITTATTTRG